MDSNPAAQAPAVPAIAEEEALVRNVVDQPTAHLIARLNAVSVTVEDLLLASAEIQTLPLKECKREARTHVLARMFKGQGDKAIAVGFRLEAMARVIRSGKIRRWVLPNIVCEVVFLAAAKQPILFTKNESFFDPKSFVAFVLENAAVDGHA
jgi:hypothetical protein